LEIIIDLPLGFPINNIISLGVCGGPVEGEREEGGEVTLT